MVVSRLQVLTIDRPGMTHDISGVFVKNNMNITWMEVYTHVIYIKFEKQNPLLHQKIIDDLLAIEGVKDVREIDFIMIEESRLEAKTILNSITQGIMILKKDATIKYVNQYAAKNIFMKDYQELIDKPIEQLIKHEQLKKLQDREDVDQQALDALEVTIDDREYILHANPITSEDDVYAGMMITLQDVHRIGELFDRKRFDNPITFQDIFGSSQAMNDAIRQAKMFAASDSPVLILGESGTGKEIFARAIHNESMRCSKMFVALNCAAVPDQLLESELFGYEEGAFTGGKKKGKNGLLETANGGTIFFDEIGEMSPHLQAKLLRVLQENKIRRLGSTKEVSIDVRVLSATNRELQGMLSSGQFRLDLYYRINVFTLHISPLRERVEDIKLLAKKFVHEYAMKYHKPIKKIHQDAMEALIRYDWPGNVRELQNVIERAVAVTHGNKIMPDSIKMDLMPEKEKDQEIEPLRERVEQYEKEVIIKALKESKSIREASRKLKVTHTLLLNRMKKYQLENR